MKLLASILLILWLVPTWSAEPRVPLWGPAPSIKATPVALDSSDPARRTVGALTYLGGWRLTSRDAAFGGISSMSVAGDRFTMLSDYSLVTEFDLGARGAISNVRFGELPSFFSTGWAKPDVDSESMARDPRTGVTWAGYENWNAVVRFSSGFGHRTRAARPRPMQGWDGNGGAESMVRLANGAFLLLSERSHWPHARGRAGLWVAGDPTRPGVRGFRFAYLPPAGYDPSDAAVLPGGRLLILNRRFALPFNFTAKLTMLDLKRIKPNALVRGQEVATLAAPLIHDNFEALAVTREGDDTILWIASDDNQLFLERTLLLKFRLDGADKRKAPAEAGANSSLH
ncbi:hypothetical protein BH09PSE4_BH09PSE4_06750 [soil metagenome]